MFLFVFCYRRSDGPVTKTFLSRGQKTVWLSVAEGKRTTNTDHFVFLTNYFMLVKSRKRLEKDVQTYIQTQF